MGRGHVELVHTPEIAPVPVPGSGWPVGAKVKILSEDDETGALTGVLILDPGYYRNAGHSTADTELFVIGGSLRIGEIRRGWGYYEWAPAGTSQETWIADPDTGCELLFMARSAAPDFVHRPGPGGTEGRIEIDTEFLPWTVLPIPGVPPGPLIKELRHVEQTGEALLLISTPPRFRYPQMEYHDCIEEIFLVEGDILLGNSGWMHAGSYFWRPAYVTHGPFYSPTAKLIIAWNESTLNTHHVDDPTRTPEENRREAESRQGELVDYLRSSSA